nr:unnamed protein product [Digitaria exilis]
MKFSPVAAMARRPSTVATPAVCPGAAATAAPSSSNTARSHAAAARSCNATPPQPYQPEQWPVPRPPAGELVQFRALLSALTRCRASSRGRARSFVRSFGVRCGSSSPGCAGTTGVCDSTSPWRWSALGSETTTAASSVTESKPTSPVQTLIIHGFGYYTGYPKDLGPSRIIPFTSERQFVQLLHEGRPVVVAFTIKCTYTQHLDKVLEEAAATFYPHIKFVRVSYFASLWKFNIVYAASQGKSVDPNITKYSVKVLPFNYDQSLYGFREYFKKHGFKYSETN